MSAGDRAVVGVAAEIRAYLAGRLAGGPAPPDDDEPLVSSGRLDSLDLLQIMSFILQRYRVDLMEVGTPRDFDTVAALAAVVARHQPARPA